MKKLADLSKDLFVLSNKMISNLITAQRNKYGKKEVKLEDDGSKFGTLVLLQSNRYEIIEGKPLHVQIGNLYFIFYSRD